MPHFLLPLTGLLAEGEKPLRNKLRYQFVFLFHAKSFPTLSV